MKIPEVVKVIAFDADDTLWDNQTYFEEAEQVLCQVLSPWAAAEEVKSVMYGTEQTNMPTMGFGTKAFTISLMETALKVSGEQISGKDMGKLIAAGKRILNMPATPLPGVEHVLARLQLSGQYRLVLFTKGDLLDQQCKLRRSGLEKYFAQVNIVSDKGMAEYQSLCEACGIRPEELLMVGNSFRSDIAPVVKLGGWGVHIPFYVSWQLELMEEFEHPHIIRLRQIEDLL